MTRAAPAIVATLLSCACTGGGEVEPTTRPPGATESGRTNVLEAGAKVLQDNGPLAKHDVYLVGFHPMKLHPRMQMEAHHFCRQVNEDFAQCVLFDGNGVDANLSGIEYIVSERLFEQLPAAERRYWHPHNAEILSGQLIAPNLPTVAETELMRKKINSYGKTWHTWHVGHGVQSPDALPMGPALLAWSFNRDGEARPGMIEDRDRRMRVSTRDARERRKELVSLAKPQEGVDALRAGFPDAVPIPGVSGKAGAGKETDASR